MGVSVNQVRFGARGRKHHCRDKLQFFIRFEPAQHFHPVHLGQAQIQENQVRLGTGLGVGIGGMVEEIVQRRLAVFHVNDAVGHAKTSQVASHDLGMCRVVFHQQNGDGVSFNHNVISMVLCSSF